MLVTQYRIPFLLYSLPFTSTINQCLFFFRSTRSVPALALATWDGEPCPVHGHGIPPPPLFHAGTMRRHGSLFDVRPPALFGPPPGPLMDKKSFHGSMQLVNTPWYAPPLMRPRPLVVPAGAEPLPVRDPFRRPPGYPPSKMAEDPDYDKVCCKGHLIVLWIILGVVTVGVILGIVLGVTIAQWPSET